MGIYMAQGHLYMELVIDKPAETAKIYGVECKLQKASTRDWYNYQDSVSKALKESDLNLLLEVRDAFLSKHGVPKDIIDSLTVEHSGKVIDFIGGASKK